MSAIPTAPNPKDPDWEAPLLETSEPRPDLPVLLSGHRSAAILSAAGEMQLPWETRGARIEWGGAYAQGVRLTGPWTLQVGSAGGAPQPLSTFLRSLSVRRTEVTSTYQGPGWTARQEVVVPHDEPAVTRRLLLTGMAETGLDLSIGMRVEPFLLPVLMEGLRPRVYALRGSPTGFALSAEGYALELLSSEAPTSLSVEGRALSVEPSTQPVPAVDLVWNLHLDPAEMVRLSWVVWGGMEKLVRMEPDHGARLLSSSVAWRDERRSSQALWWNERPRFRFPQDPLLEEGALLATGALEALTHAPEPGMVGMVAGYPWYYALWFRDIAWMLPAVLWLGDFDWARATLGTAFNFQSRAHVPVLGAEPGEVPMQVSPGPIFLYGTSDTTLHFPALAYRFLQHAGVERASFLRPLLPHVAGCLAWADRKVSPQTGLFTNGGEIAEMAAAAQQGKVQCGIDALDTTIWDSTDRRAHAVDLQVLHVRALRAATGLAGALGAFDGAPSGGEERAQAIQQKVLNSYRWPSEDYLVDTLTPEGEPVNRLRPNALLAVMDGWLPREQAQAMIRRAACEDLTTPWGVRTLSRKDPNFDPEAYHDGQVWTIATDWAAHAALRARCPEEGLAYLHTVTGLLKSEHGLANECYHGLRAQPFDSCFLLGLSVGPFLTALFEGLWGLSFVPGQGAPVLRVDPAFPSTWQEASLENLRVGDTILDLHWTPGKLKVEQRSGPALEVQGGEGLEVLPVSTGSP
ncbi:MAG: hypothetical protein KGJ23_10140 [Euryarchaeota archaeon]|nr:hypothetical protein [Euryarchaeota archaeon]MDE1836964.1 hypothetical protein [Euryarchaeota archaeon]MDE1880784.1 hypothetical protein [Euryarchaeota archaeon]MDE2045851.1 hypothetical protein [Thermoplasmata archaeon]